MKNIGVLSIFIFVLGLSAHAQITSTFDTDSEGWTALNANVGEPMYTSTGGNPGGFILASDGVAGQTTFLVAPSKFHGNRIYSYGHFLRFDLKVALISNVNGNGDVKIFGGGTSLVKNISPLPNITTWTTYSLRLDETELWRIGSTGGPTATKEQVKQVLSAITDIHIGVEYNSLIIGATDRGFLDNVILEQRALLPAPIISSFTPTAGVPGTSITITGSNFGSLASNNTVYFGSIGGTIANASATSLTVTVPAGAMYGPISVINKTTGLSKQSATPFTPTFTDGGRIIPASFDPKFDIVTSVQTGGLVMADVDSDGWNDLVIAKQDNSGIDVYRNLGIVGDLTVASFATKVTFPTGGASTNGSGLRIMDLDGDGKLDMVTSAWNGSQGIFITFRNTSTPGNITFESAESWAGKSDESPPYEVVDIDGDGLPELIGGEGSGGAGQNVWILQNISSSGNIEFGYSLFYFSDTLDDAASGATIADLDNDGKPEFILKRNFGGIFTVFKNTSTPRVISFGTNFSITQSINGEINVADFNLDGKNDLAWKAGFTNDDVHIRINTNSGGALAASDFATEVILNSELNYYGGISLTDLNGDGKVDIMATDGTDFGIFENIYTGGVFSANSFTSAYKRPGNSFYPTTIVAGDLNGDTKPDLVFSSTDSPSRLSIIENKNVHTPVISLTTVSPLAAPVGSTVTITGDYFSTTTTDNLVQFGTVKATVLTATKTQLTVTVPPGAQYAPVSVTRDRLTSTYHLPFRVTFSSGTSFDATSFASPISFTLTSAYYDLVTGDLNSDGKPDVVATGGTFDAYAFRNTHSSGSISTSSLIADDTLDSFAYNILPSLQDFDGDGKTDLIVHEGYIYQNLSTPSEIDFTNSPSFEFYSLNHSFGDFDHDGKIDLVGTRFSSSQIIATTNKTTTGTFVFFNGIQADFASFDIGTMAVSFTKPAIFGYTAVADFDNDGWADMVATNSATDNFTIWKNNQTNRISTASFTNVGDITTGDNLARIYSGDLDVDGKVDLMMNYSTGTSSGIFSILRNTSTAGTISFERQDFTIGAGSNGGASAIGDLDGDGKPEIIVSSEATNVFRIFKNNTTPGIINATSFVASPTYAVTTPRALAIGDINLDGKPEIIITSAPNSLLVFENLIPSVSINFTTQPATVTICEGNNSTFSVVATGDTNLQYQWQIDNASFVNLSNNATYSGVNTATLMISNPALALSGAVFRCQVRGDNSLFTPSTAASLTINEVPVMDLSTTTRCSDEPLDHFLVTAGSITASTFTISSKIVPVGLAESGNALVPASGVALDYLANEKYTNKSMGVLFVDYVIIPVSSDNCAGPPATISFAINPEPTLAPNLNKQICSDSPVEIILVAAPGSISTDNFALLSVTVEPGLIPAASNASPAGDEGDDFLANDSFTNTTTGPLKVTYLVEGVNVNGCSSDPVSIEVTVFPLPCTNQPPAIASSVTAVPIEGVVVIDLITLISDADNNLDLSTLRVVSTTSQQGAAASIDGSNQLVLDYGTILFAGIDQVTIEVCDLFGECTQQVLEIEVIGDIEIYNGISPNSDDQNEIFLIRYIDLFPGTQENIVIIYNRWGSKVFEIENYNNTTRVFRGLNENGSQLPSGTYFYKIEFKDDKRPTQTGYLSLKR